MYMYSTEFKKMQYLLIELKSAHTPEYIYADVINLYWGEPAQGVAHCCYVCVGQFRRIRNWMEFHEAHSQCLQLPRKTAYTRFLQSVSRLASSLFLFIWVYQRGMDLPTYKHLSMSQVWGIYVSKWQLTQPTCSGDHICNSPRAVIADSVRFNRQLMVSTDIS